jgi:predicted CXXCH cytochrome family protein
LRGFAIGLLIVTIALPAFADAEPEEESAYAPSEALVELLEMTSEETGQVVVTAEQRAYFDSLPARAKQLFDEAIEYEVMTEADHLGALLDLDLRPSEIELLMEDFCIVCHADPWQDIEVIFSADPEATGSPEHLNLKRYTADVHFRRGVSCAGCHGGDPLDVVMSPPTYQSMPKAPKRHEDRTWVPEFCARCHADPTYMRRFNPNLPTDQYSKYLESRHGKLLLGEGDSKPAQCVSCHGSHGILSAKSPRSSIHPKNVPATCGACHADADYMKGYLTQTGEPLPTDQLESYRTSIHGRALLERGDLGAPACNDCHGNHAAMPPEISSVAGVCRTCHSGNGELFDGTSHKIEFERNGWSECAHCHGTHSVAEADDSMLDEEANALCYECHREYAKDNPKCEETAKYFHTSITNLARGSNLLAAQIEHLAERGLDVEPLALNVEELGDVLKRARSRIHAFDKSEFASVEALGVKTLESGNLLVEEAESEYRFRRNGLLVAVATMILLAVLMTLKIREIDSNE